MIFFSGMGANESIFLPQQTCFPSLIVVPWQVPEKGESLVSYCARLAKDIDPGCPCIVGGASFGGIVALEIASQLDALGCILIGSVRSPDEIPKRIRAFRIFAPILKFLPLNPLKFLARQAIPVLRWLRAKHIAGLAKQFSASDSRVIRWSIKQVFHWNRISFEFPIRQIHGKNDFVFPISRLEPDATVEGGGHVISLTHPRKVNAFIRESLDVFQSQPEA